MVPCTWYLVPDYITTASCMYSAVVRASDTLLWYPLVYSGKNMHNTPRVRTRYRGVYQVVWYSMYSGNGMSAGGEGEQNPATQQLLFWCQTTTAVFNTIILIPGSWK